MEEARKLSVKIKDNDEPQVSISGDSWKSSDIRAVKRLIDRAYRRWQKQQRKKELAEMRNNNNKSDDKEQSDKERVKDVLKQATTKGESN